VIFPFGEIQYPVLLMYFLLLGLLYLAANLEAKSSLIVMSVPDKKKAIHLAFSVYSNYLDVRIFGWYTLHPAPQQSSA